MTTRAIDVPCPTCGAPAQTLCVAGSIQLTTYHHPRIKAAGNVTRERNRKERRG